MLLVKPTATLMRLESLWMGPQYSLADWGFMLSVRLQDHKYFLMTLEKRNLILTIQSFLEN